MLAADFCHYVASVLLAEYCCHAAPGVENWLPRAGIMCATLAGNVHLAVLGVLLAICGCLAAFDI